MTPDAAPARYRAFISYSHADAGFGRRLHRQLEGYAVPGRLVGRATPRGPVPRRLAPIFRDREELPAAHDLSAEVRAALAASGALVVVCSPRAAASPWVGREVALFRELHPDRPVLCALVEGEPAEAFPEILRAGGAEPLAADFREGRDGARLGLLKLVAGVVGVGLDELIQRDAQRRLQRVMGVTAASVTAMVAMGVLTLFALNARAEAERERAKAEGLVEFMITDLRDTLKDDVGRLSVLEAVNRRALGYYQDQNLGHMSAASLLRRAEILQAMGEDDEKRGNFQRALAQAQEARRTTAALLKASPDNGERIYAHAQSEFWVAAIQRRLGKHEAARAGLHEYRRLTARLAEMGPRNADWLMEAGYGESNIGTVTLRELGDAKGAESHFARALVHFEAAARIKAGDAEALAGIQSDIADGHGWLADAYRGQGLFDRARESRRAEERLLNVLKAGAPGNVQYPRMLLYNSLGLAQIDLDEGRPEDALPRLRSTWAEARRLAAADPSDNELARQRIATGLFLTKAVLAARAPLQDARAGLAECSQVAAAEREISDFCAVLAARLARAEGRTIDPAFTYLDRNRARMIRIRRSPDWGIDFARELSTPNL